MRETKNQEQEVEWQHFVGRQSEYPMLLNLKKRAEFMGKEPRLILQDNCNMIWLLSIPTVRI